MDSANFFNKCKHYLRDRKIVYRLTILLIIILSVFLYRFFIYHFTYSRYGYVYANVVNVNSRVPGTLEKIYIKDNQQVKQGQKLLQIDQRPYFYELNKAKATLTQAEVAYSTAQTAIKIASANLEQRQSQLDLITDHLKRYKELVKTGSVSEIKYIDYFYKAASLKNEVNATAEQLLKTRQALTMANVKEAQAQLNTAQYNFDNTIIYAQVNGLITNFELLSGDFLAKGEELFALVDNSEWWIITRYRETVLRKMNIGDEVKVFIDMYPWKIFHGVVESIDWGINRKQASSSAASSSLEYVEPTEYWIRLSQRFPVRIRITDVDPNYPLRVGANARTYVITK